MPRPSKVELEGKLMSGGAGAEEGEAEEGGDAEVVGTSSMARMLERLETWMLERRVQMLNFIVFGNKRGL